MVCFQIFLFLQFSEKRHVFPQIGYICYVMFATLGYNSLPFIYMAELFPLQVEYGFFTGRITFLMYLYELVCKKSGYLSFLGIEALKGKLCAHEIEKS